MSARHLFVFSSAFLLLAACGTRTSSSIEPTAGAAPSSGVVRLAPKPVEAVSITEGDITDRPYISLGDISVTVSKWTIFDSDPTQEKVAEALRAKAAEMGADAVVLARYGSVGIGVLSWGEREGKGRAVVFK